MPHTTCPHVTHTHLLHTLPTRLYIRACLRIRTCHSDLPACYLFKHARCAYLFTCHSMQSLPLPRRVYHAAALTWFLHTFSAAACRQVLTPLYCYAAWLRLPRRVAPRCDCCLHAHWRLLRHGLPFLPAPASLHCRHHYHHYPHLRLQRAFTCRCALPSLRGSPREHAHTFVQHTRALYLPAWDGYSALFRLRHYLRTRTAPFTATNALLHSTVRITACFCAVPAALQS